jgi:hypothetical protein
METETIASIFVGLCTLVLATVSILILRRTKDINERLLRIEEVRNVSEMRIIDEEVYFYNGFCYFRFDNCGGAPAYLERMELDAVDAVDGLRQAEAHDETVRTSAILPPTVFDVGFPTGEMKIDGSEAFILTVKYRLIDDDRCIPSHVHFKLTFKEDKGDGMMIYAAERKDGGMMASVLEEMEKKKNAATQV